jgi:hypothetical protein
VQWRAGLLLCRMCLSDVTHSCRVRRASWHPLGVVLPCCVCHTNRQLPACSLPARSGFRGLIRMPCAGMSLVPCMRHLATPAALLEGLDMWGVNEGAASRQDNCTVQRSAVGSMEWLHALLVCDVPAKVRHAACCVVRGKAGLARGTDHTAVLLPGALHPLERPSYSSNGPAFITTPCTCWCALPDITAAMLQRSKRHAPGRGVACTVLISCGRMRGRFHVLFRVL